MSIGGKKRVVQDYNKKIGLFEAEIIAVNPTAEEFTELTGQEVKEDSKAFEYLGEKEVDGKKVKTVRITFYLRDVKTEELFNVSYFLEDKNRESQDGSKCQWINSVGTLTWEKSSKSEDELPEWFIKGREVRKAKAGEEDLYNFLRSWLQLDYFDAETSLVLDTKKLFKGNVRDIKDQIGTELTTLVDKKTGKESPVTLIFVAGVRTKEKDGEKKTNQTINSKYVLPGYNMKNFMGKKFTKKDFKDLVELLERENKTKEDWAELKKYKPWEKFVGNLLQETYPVKEFIGTYIGELREYDPSEDPASSDEVMAPAADADTDDSDY